MRPGRARPCGGPSAPATAPARSPPFGHTGAGRPGPTEDALDELGARRELCGRLLRSGAAVPRTSERSETSSTARARRPRMSFDALLGAGGRTSCASTSAAIVGARFAAGSSRTGSSMGTRPSEHRGLAADELAGPTRGHALRTDDYLSHLLDMGSDSPGRQQVTAHLEALPYAEGREDVAVPCDAVHVGADGLLGCVPVACSSSMRARPERKPTILAMLSRSVDAPELIGPTIRRPRPGGPEGDPVHDRAASVAGDGRFGARDLCVLPLVPVGPARRTPETASRVARQPQRGGARAR